MSMRSSLETGRGALNGIADRDRGSAPMECGEERMKGGSENEIKRGRKGGKEVTKGSRKDWRKEDRME